MKSNNIKKIIPGFISMAIILGMAIQSFATNVDMAAFVKKDKYMAKYYELDWRIDNIESTLEKLYKFVCTNVRTYGGNNRYTYCNTVFFQDYGTQTHVWYPLPIADLSEEGYLRVSANDALNWFGNHSKTDKFEAEFPASLFKWRNGIELYPTTKIKHVITRTVPNTTAHSQIPSITHELIMGPFKKFPRVTATGTAGAYCISNGWAAAFYNSSSFTALYYNYGTDTQPTSWSTMTGSLGFSTFSRNTSSLPSELKGGVLTKEEMEAGMYRGADKREVNAFWTGVYQNPAIGADLSSYDKVWIRATSPATNVSSPLIDPTIYKITTWNNNK